jgi:SH3 domain protein
MHESPGSGKKVETLITGSELKVLEKTRTHTKVRTSSGNTGWAKSAYLVSEKPARLIVDQLTKKNQKLADKLESEIKKTKGERKKLSKLQQESKSAIEASNNQADKLQRLEKENLQFKEYMAAYSSSMPFSVFMPAIILCLIAGYIACYFWIDYQSRKRHGGFKIQ